MEQDFLFNPDEPALALLPATESAVYDLMGVWTPANPEWDILRVGGERGKSIDTARFMNQVAARTDTQTIPSRRARSGPPTSRMKSGSPQTTSCSRARDNPT